jgi:hypothetical protein
MGDGCGGPAALREHRRAVCSGWRVRNGYRLAQSYRGYHHGWTGLAKSCDSLATIDRRVAVSAPISDSVPVDRFYRIAGS